MCVEPLSPRGTSRRRAVEGPGQCTGSGLRLPRPAPSVRHARGPTYCPPKSCMPSRAKTTMNRNSRKRRLMIDFMELSRDTTRFRSELQYLLGQAGSACTWPHPLGPEAQAGAPLWTLTVTPVAPETLSPQGPHTGMGGESSSSEFPIPPPGAPDGRWRPQCPGLDSPLSPKPALVTLPGRMVHDLSPPLSTRAASRCLCSDHEWRMSHTRRRSAQRPSPSRSSAP